MNFWLDIVKEEKDQTDYFDQNALIFIIEDFVCACVCMWVYYHF